MIYKITEDKIKGQTIQEFIQDRMAKKNMTSYQLSKASGVHMNAVYRFVTGKQGMTAEKFLRLLSALDLNLAD